MYYWSVLSRGTGEIAVKTTSYWSLQSAVRGAISFIEHDWKAFKRETAFDYLITIYTAKPPKELPDTRTPFAQYEYKQVF